MSPDLSAISVLVSERMGLHYPPDRWGDLARGLEKATAALGYANVEALVAHLLADQFGQREIQALASHLTIGETHFFRTPDLFATLESWLLPELIAAQQAAGRRLRIWSAGCATGQEAYSLAILLKRLIPKPDAWDLTILASDINLDSIASAKTAQYTQWSFRGTPSWVINGYFTKLADGRFSLDPAIREMVTFRYLNLAEDAYPSLMGGIGEFDLILCRNVLMYFSQPTVKMVGNRLHRSLKDQGYLIVTPSEASRDVQHSMTSMMRGGEILYKKTPPVQSEVAANGLPKRETRPGQEPTQSGLGSGGRPHRAAHKRQAETAPASRPRSGASPAAPSEPTWPAVDRRGEGRPFAAYATQKAADATGATVSPRTRRQAAPVDARKAAQEARQLADKGDRKQALALCEAALEVDKLNPSLYYLKASVLQEMGRHDEAERALQSILFLDGDFALARVMLGAIARGQSRWGEAAKHFGAALSQLAQMPPDSVLPETDGLTAGEMAETVASLMGSECVL